MKTASAPPAAHFVSVIIPCRNEERFITGCLRSVLASSSANVEILVIDGDSDDGTRDLVTEIAARNPQVRLLANPTRVTPAALNIGIRAAKGDIIIRMDAHARYPPDYVGIAVERLDATGAWVVGGPIETVTESHNSISRAIAMATSHPFGVGNSKFRTSQHAGNVDTVPFGAYRRETFDRVGVFDETLFRNQDNELSSRITAAGGTIYMTPELRAHYYAREDISGILVQAFRTGMWNVATVKRNVAAFSPRHFVPFVFVTALVGTAMAAVFAPPAGLLFLLLAGTYAAVALAASVQRLLQAGDAAALWLPVVFCLYHLTYGVGTWAGVIRASFSSWPSVSPRSPTTSGSTL